MENQSKKVTEEKLKNQACSAVDNLAKQVKQETRGFFDLLVENTVNVFGELFDNYVDKAKEKIKREDKNEK